MNTGYVAQGRLATTRHDWETPSDLFERLDAEFAFTLDACGSADNRKVHHYFSSEDLVSALAKPWTGVVWVNPPYGKTLGQWVEKAYRSSLEGATVVCLVPSRTDVAWWHDYAMKAAEIRFFRGRLRFGEAKWNAPYPSALLVFRAT